MPSSPWIDVSVPLRTGMAHWPGDPAARIRRDLDLAKGDPCTVTSLELCAHAGTHMDAPAHYLADGCGMDAMPLDVAVGVARVIALEDGDSVTPEALREHRIRRGERLLFKTANSGRCWDRDDFVEDFVAISQAAADFLAARQVRLVGVDYLSVAGYRADGAAVHRALLGAGIWIIEGLNLSRVPPGRVELVCLPLRLAGAEGAPARAIVRPLAGRTG
ncbi:cyclase family protein [Solidesulfovibrio sp.]|uniref:cyclase family protein n=1 Tax=Solidesulfovibrio sp. TaxID=2910990 RepID=UPI002622EE9C|nr:cyclase family protein [Solidesulfovibrio sp.]